MLDKLRNTFDRGVAIVSVKSESLVESSRTRTALANLQKQIDSKQATLGIRFYADWSSGRLDMDQLEADCRAIRQLEDEATDLLRRIEQIKEEENKILGTQKASVICEKCGKALALDSRFCEECGTPVNHIKSEDS